MVTPRQTPGTLLQARSGAGDTGREGRRWWAWRVPANRREEPRVSSAGAATEQGTAGRNCENCLLGSLELEKQRQTGGRGLCRAAAVGAIKEQYIPLKEQEGYEGYPEEIQRRRQGEMEV